MKNKTGKISLILTLIFGGLFIVLYGIQSIFRNIVLNYMFWTRWNELLIILFLFVLFAVMYIVNISNKLYKWIGSLIGLFLLFVLLIVNIFGFHGMRSMESDHHKIYIITTGFNQRGLSTVYLDENFLYSLEISSTAVEAGTYEVEYTLNGEVLHIVLNDYLQDTSNTIDIDLSNYD